MVPLCTCIRPSAAAQRMFCGSLFSPSWLLLFYWESEWEIFGGERLPGTAIHGLPTYSSRNARVPSLFSLRFEEQAFEYLHLRKDPI